MIYLNEFVNMNCRLSRILNLSHKYSSFHDLRDDPCQCSDQRYADLSALQQKAPDEQGAAYVTLSDGRAYIKLLNEKNINTLLHASL